jgi:beta-galactosidase
VTPVHLFTSGDEAELFINGKSMGRRTKAPFEYRLRWDDVTSEPGELKAIAYRNGKEWATATVRTAGGPGEIVATDNGDPTSFEPFHAHERAAFNGLCLVVVRGKANPPGPIVVRAESGSLQGASVTVQSVKP